MKVFSGDDELIDEIDKPFRIDINKEFPADQAKQLKEAVGKSLWQVIALPDHRWTCMRRWYDVQVVCHADLDVLHQQLQAGCR